MPEQHPESPDQVDLSPGAPVTPAGPLAAADRKALWWVLGLLLVVQLVALYSPGTVGVSGPPYTDKVVHLAIFGLPLYVLGRLTPRRWLWAGVFAVHAGVSEVVQYWFVPGRNGDVLDFAANLVGIGIALLALRWHRTAG